MAKINETNYPRRQASEYASTDMFIVQPVPDPEQEHSGDSRTTRVSDLKEYMLGDADPSKIGTPAAGTYTSAANTNAQNIAALDYALANYDHLTKQVATQAEINGYIADPTTADFNVIYLLKDTSATGSDKYFEYMRLGTPESSTFEMTGDTSTDLSNYFTKAEINAALADKVSKSVTAGLLKNDGTVDTNSYATSAEAFKTNDTAETALADGDYFPYYDTSATGKRKTLWSNIKAKLKTYFDGLYSAKATSKGSATKGVYFDANGAVQEMSYTVGKSVPSDAVFTDTKNTAGSTDSSSKLFLIGATSQAANPRTYSQDTAYVETDGCLYSGGTKVLTAHQDISGKADKVSGATSGNVATLDANGNLVDSNKTLGKSVPSDAVFTDTNTKVTQTNTTGSADYRVLLSENANDTTQTVGARKSANLKFNPSTGNLQTQKINGVAVGSSPKFTDSGHTILNGSGSAMNQRGKLQFVGATVTDDGTNDKTVVSLGTTVSVTHTLSASANTNFDFTDIGASAVITEILATDGRGYASREYINSGTGIRFVFAPDSSTPSVTMQIKYR